MAYERWGLLVYVNENIPSPTLHEYSIHDDIEILCAEINLRKHKWVLLGIYPPPPPSPSLDIIYG